MNQGILVISLDFELMWGNVESWQVDGYGKTNVAQVRDVFHRLIPLIEQHEIKLTVGTVGLIMQQGSHDKITPDCIPSYKRAELSPYNLINHIKPENKDLYFAPDLVEILKSSPNIEIGSHTYCHYYCWEEGQTAKQFEADIRKAVQIASQHGINMKSIIFPRNEVQDEYLHICSKYGFTNYRGNATKYFNKPKSTLDSYRLRLCRLIDAYINISGHTSYKLEKDDSPMLNIRASRFVRPYNPKFAFLDKLRIQRICNEMEYAARNNEIYHLWWHPHNMGANLTESIAFVETILKAYYKCHKMYGMQSMTMGELSLAYKKASE